MIKFSRDKVLLLHQIISAETGGDPELRNINLLDSALESAFQTFDGQELYPTKEEKAARIGYALISSHAFVDGNKRIGIYVLLTFLETNGIKIRPSNEEVVRVGLATRGMARLPARVARGAGARLLSPCHHRLVPAQ